MSKKSLIILMLMLVGSISHAQMLLPPTVQEFMDEYNVTKGLKANKQAQMRHTNRFVPPHMVDGQEMVDAFIGIKDANVIPLLQNSGVVVNSLFDEFVTAQIPVDKLYQVSSLRGVTDVEISKRVEFCTDSTLKVTHTTMVHNGELYDLPHGYDGTGVIVGIIDSGFDFQHRAYMSNDDTTKTRIVRVYNTHDNSGHIAAYNKVVKLPGSVFMGDEIYSLTYDTNGTHGTHTSSIAAGSHVNGYGGMAPGADIVLCAANDFDGGVSLVEVANCVRYVDAYADSVGKPCVISLSVSTADGYHDGKDYLTKAISKITGKGRIFVIAAGNNGKNRFYAHKVASKTDPINLVFNSYSSSSADSTYYYAGHKSDIWVRDIRNNLYYKIHVLDKYTGKIVWESEEYSSSQMIESTLFSDYYDCDTTVYSSGYIKTTLMTTSDGTKYGINVAVVNLKCQSYTTVSGVKQSRYALGITLYPRKDNPCTFDAWTCVSKSAFGAFNSSVTTLDGEVKNGFYSAGSDSCSIGTFAVGDSIISAGGYIARNSYFSLFRNRTIIDRTLTIGDIMAMSSYQAEGYGPTGKALPDICAPSVNVVAAGSRYSYFANGHQNTVMKTADGSYWGVMTGTSMAAPTVAGIIALWLQANPDLTVAQIKDIFAQSAIRDSFTLGPNSAHFGPNGKIDAMTGMRLVLEQMGFIVGDVDGDGVIGVSDLTTLIDYLLGANVAYFDERAADVDQNGDVSVSDITTLIDIMLSRN